ncbi:hypothetical protein BJ912DRAFT_1044810 [Pholiota molesta]|nr:hypothetical protein BJ912DRAFT_1044810 [Pholiota molesta]
MHLHPAVPCSASPSARIPSCARTSCTPFAQPHYDNRHQMAERKPTNPLVSCNFCIPLASHTAVSNRANQKREKKTKKKQEKEKENTECEIQWHGYSRHPPACLPAVEHRPPPSIHTHTHPRHPQFSTGCAPKHDSGRALPPAYASECASRAPRTLSPSPSPMHATPRRLAARAFPAYFQRASVQRRGPPARRAPLRASQRVPRQRANPPSTQHPAPSTQHPTHPAPSTQHPAPSTQHPAPTHPTPARAVHYGGSCSCPRARRRRIGTLPDGDGDRHFPRRGWGAALSQMGWGSALCQMGVGRAWWAGVGGRGWAFVVGVMVVRGGRGGGRGGGGLRARRCRGGHRAIYGAQDDRGDRHAGAGEHTRTRLRMRLRGGYLRARWGGFDARGLLVVYLENRGGGAGVGVVEGARSALGLGGAGTVAPGAPWRGVRASSQGAPTAHTLPAPVHPGRLCARQTRGAWASAAMVGALAGAAAQAQPWGGDSRRAVRTGAVARRLHAEHVTVQSRHLRPSSSCAGAQATRKSTRYSCSGREITDVWARRVNPAHVQATAMQEGADRRARRRGEGWKGKAHNATMCHVTDGRRVTVTEGVDVAPIFLLLSDPMSADQLFIASRAEQRRLRLLETERELAAEEADALTLTEDQRQTLLRPFAAVKAEFADLDGLRWTQTALRRRQPPAPPHHHHRAHDPDASIYTPATANAFAVLTNADLAAFAPDDTIRAPHPPPRTRPRFPSPLIRGATSLPPADSPREHHARPPPAGHRDGTRTRSPVKGLFARDGDADGGGWAPRESWMEDMEEPGAGGDSDGGGQRPPPPGLTTYSSAAAASGARRATTAGTLLESPAAPFPSPFPAAPPRSPADYASSSTPAHPSHSSSLPFTRSPTGHTPVKPPFTSTSASALSVLTAPTSRGAPPQINAARPARRGTRPPRRTPPPPPPTHTPTTTTSPPRSSTHHSRPPRTTPRPLVRAASFSVFPASSSHTSTSPPAVSLVHAHARVAALLAQTPSPTAARPSSEAARAPVFLRARSASSSASGTVRLKSDTVRLGSDTVRQAHHPRRGLLTDAHTQAHQLGGGVNGTSAAAGGWGAGEEDDDTDGYEEVDAEETPRASPVEIPAGGAAGVRRSPSRGWIRGFA